MSAVAEPLPGAASRWGAFWAVLYRDLYVTWREFPAFLAQVILQPLFLLFVFGKVLGSLGYTQNNYADLLFPGLLALTAVITSMQTLAFPLVAEFGWTREIEDRLLAPMPTGFVAAEKVLFALLRAMVADDRLTPTLLATGSHLSSAYGSTLREVEEWVHVVPIDARLTADALEKLQYDFFYLQRQTLGLDVRIVARTVRDVCKGGGR